MANEPERPIEKLLRAAGQKRRDEAGGPFELHPASRRVLQGEVARRLGKPQREGSSFWFRIGQLWPRLALGAAIFAVLGVVVWLALPGTRDERSPALLARNESVREAATAKQPIPTAPTKEVLAPAPATEAPQTRGRAVSYAERSQGERRDATPQLGKAQQQLAETSPRQTAANEPMDKLSSAASPAPADRKKIAEAEFQASGGAVAQAPAGSVSGASERRYGLAGGAVQPANAPAPAAAPPTFAVTPPPISAGATDEASRLKDAEAGKQALAFRSLADSASANRLRRAPATTDALGTPYAASLKAERSPGVTQGFTQVTAGQKVKLALSDQASTKLPVLASFQMEQSGSELRIVDGDGSVYSGSLQFANATQISGGVNAKPSVASEAIRAPKDADAQAPAARPETEQLAPQSYFFRVSGTNRSLRQQVVFTGNLLPSASTNKAVQTGTSLGVVNNFGAFQGNSAQLGAVPLMNTRISGKVVVGDGQAVEIDAEATKP